jgi:glycosyltransferase involved in cell wall biosynthesis
VKFSIVTISYNQSRFLEQAIRSVIEQDYIDIEYIVVDAGSTDSSREIIERYRNKITKVILEADSGPSDGLNKGFATATGDIYGYLNADDVLLPHAINKASNFFKCNANVDVVSGHCYVMDEKGVKLQKAFSHRFDLRRYFVNSCVLIQQSTFFRSDIFNKTKGFNTNNNISWDGELFVDFALQGAKFAVTHDYWSCFRVYKKSITGSSEYFDKLSKEHINIQKKIGYNRISKLERKYLWVKGWLLQPKTLALRIFDGIINRNRLL